MVRSSQIRNESAERDISEVLDVLPNDPDFFSRYPDVVSPLMWSVIIVGLIFLACFIFTCVCGCIGERRYRSRSFYIQQEHSSLLENQNQMKKKGVQVNMTNNKEFDPASKVSKV